jgi:NAD(P)-dependent dehydrogenase (short-subunit alcohol dehydrogenase family)
VLDPKVEERVVLVTGTNNPYGIGAAIAQGFATQGARVFLHYLRGTPKSGADARSDGDDSAGESGRPPDLMGFHEIEDKGHLILFGPANRVV